MKNFIKRNRYLLSTLMCIALCTTLPLSPVLAAKVTRLFAANPLALTQTVNTTPAAQAVWMPGSNLNNVSVPSAALTSVNVCQDFSCNSLLGTLAPGSNATYNVHDVLYLISPGGPSAATVTPQLVQTATSLAVPLSATTLTLTQAQYLARTIDFTGSPGAGVAVTFPTTKGYLWYIENNSGQTVTLQTSGQSGPPTLITTKHAVYVIDDTGNLIQWTAAN